MQTRIFVNEMICISVFSSSAFKNCEIIEKSSSPLPEETKKKKKNIFNPNVQNNGFIFQIKTSKIKKNRKIQLKLFESLQSSKQVLRLFLC